MDPVEALLEHHGIKGMKWGVRRSGERGAIRRGVTKANVALDAGSKVIKKGEEGLIFLPQAKRQKAANATQNRVLGEAVRANRDPRFHGKDIKKDSALKDAYFNEIEKRAGSIYKEELGIARNEAVADVIKTILSPSKDSMSFKASRSRIRHAEDDLEVLLTLSFTKNELGQIVGVDIANDSLAQSEDVEFILEHHGVKGMHWGVRRSSTSRPTGPAPVVVKSTKPGKLVKTAGGQRHPASEDAVTAQIHRQKARASTTDALSNKELQALVTRMNLEQQYSTLKKKNDRSSLGFRIIKSIFKNRNQTMSEVNKFNNSPQGQAVKKKLATTLAKKAAKKTAA